MRCPLWNEKSLFSEAAQRGKCYVLSLEKAISETLMLAHAPPRGGSRQLGPPHPGASRLTLHWRITSTVNRPFNSHLLLTARRAVYGINSLLTGCLTGCLWLFMAVYVLPPSPSAVNSKLLLNGLLTMLVMLQCTLYMLSLIHI